MEPADRDEEHDEELEDDYEQDYEQEHRGTLILVLGIVSLVLGCIGCQVFGVIPWMMGASDLHKMKQGIMDPAGRTHTQTGMVLGIVAFGLFVLNMVVLIVYVGGLFFLG